MKSLLTISALGLMVCASATCSQAQEAKDFVGAWTHASNVVISADGKRTDAFPDPKGQAVFTDNGRFAFIFHRGDLPKIASNNRLQATAEENKAVLGGMVALYGSYSVTDKVLLLKVDGSSFPNWAGVEQRRPILSYSPEEIKFAVPGTSAGGSNEFILKRIK
jgi:hypothetical protein